MTAVKTIFLLLVCLYMFNFTTVLSTRIILGRFIGGIFYDPGNLFHLENDDGTCIFLDVCKRLLIRFINTKRFMQIRLLSQCQDKHFNL